MNETVLKVTIVVVKMRIEIVKRVVMKVIGQELLMKMPKKTDRVRYNSNDGTPFFMLGMSFSNAIAVREALARYGVAEGKKLKIKPNDPARIIAKCVTESGCPFVILISKDGDNPGLQLKH